MTAPGADAVRPGRVRRAADLTLVFAAVALVLLAVVEIWQVFARYVLNDSPSWTEPVAVLCMNAAMMLGAAAGVHAQRHFGFFVGIHAAPPPVRRILLALSRSVQAGVGLMLAGWGFRLSLETWDVPMAGIALPQGASFVPLWVGGALIALFALDLLLRVLDLQAEGG